MSMERWHYFLSLERDFMRTMDFVHLDDANLKTFSNEYAKLLLLIGSEVDVVAKLICADVQPAAVARNIIDYQQIITQRFAGMHAIEIEIPRFGKPNKPWLAWGSLPPKSPDWWTAYNDVKHEREANFALANLENVLAGLCGLFALNLYRYRDHPHLQPYPELLNYGFPAYIVGEGGPAPPGV